MASVHFANAMAGWLPDRATIDGLLTSLGGDDRADDTAATGWGLLPGPFYTPETSLGLGIALVGLYRTGDKRPETPLSSLTLSGFASITGTFGFDFGSYNYFNGDRQRLFVRSEEHTSELQSLMR